MHAPNEKVISILKASWFCNTVGKAARWPFSLYYKWNGDCQDTILCNKGDLEGVKSWLNDDAVLCCISQSCTHNTQQQTVISSAQPS